MQLVSVRLSDGAISTDDYGRRRAGAGAKSRPVLLRPRPVRARWSLWIAWGFAAALACVMLLRLVPVCRDQLAAPFDLISEGPHMSTVKAIQSGFDIYARASFLDLPLFMTPYTPLYHTLVAVLPQDPVNPFFTGRLVAAVFVILAAATLLAVAERGHRATAVTAVAVFFLVHAVTGNTAYLRSDSMALCWSVWAVVTAARARSRSAVATAGVLGALAIAAKQSFLAAGITCLLHFASRDHRDARAFLLAGGAVGAVLGLAAWAYWGNDFWFAVTIPLTDYPRDIESFWVHWRMMFAQPLFLFILATAAVASAAACATDGWRVFAAPYLPYALVSWALQTSVMTGIGAENHNLIEPVLATLLWVVVALQQHRPQLQVGWARGAGLAALAFCTQLELRNPDSSLYSFTNPAKTARYVRERAAAQAALRDLGIERGRMLNLKNSQIPHDFAGEMVVNDVWMYITVLWNTRPETADRLVRAIEAESFDAVFVAPGVLSAGHDHGDAPWPRIIHAVFAHYTVTYRGGEVNVLTRRKPRVS